MRGYPKHINTKQDFENLLNMPEHRERALKDLEKIHNTEDSVVTRAIEPINPEEPEGEWLTEEISNPMRLFKRFGFETQEEVGALIDEHR